MSSTIGEAWRETDRSSCRLICEGLRVCEDGYRWVHFRCESHGAEWRVFAGGTTKHSCTTLASVLSPAALSARLEEEACDDFDEAERAFGG